MAATTLAFNEAGHLQQEKIAPEHLLLGLTREGEGIAVGLMRAFGTTLEKVRAQTFQAIALASGGKVAEQSPPKSNVVTCRIDGRDLDAVNALIEAGIRSTRSDAAAWLIHAGIEANRPLFEKVYGTVAEIRRLRVVAQSLAQEVAGSGEALAESRRSNLNSVTVRSFAALRMTLLHRLRLTRTTSSLKCIGACPRPGISSARAIAFLTLRKTM